MPCACLESPARASATAIAGRFVRLRERARLVAARPRACPKLPTSASSKAAKAATPAALSLKLFSLVICNACSGESTSFLQFTQMGRSPRGGEAQNIDSRQFAGGPLQFALHAGLISEPQPPHANRSEYWGYRDCCPAPW